MTRIILVFFILLSFSSLASVEEASRFYQHRYQYPDLFSKITDNQGDGFDDLYGTRNMRVVLKGYLYRGGGNNRFHRLNRRSNINPLPNDGLENLCKENFSAAVYLYGEKFDTAPTEVNCSTRFESENSLTYLNLKTLNSLTNLEKVFIEVHSSIINKKGPLYIHCWNGWHASGYTAATALIQFCGMKNEDAVKYWDANTDGNNTNPKYEKIRQRIRNFKPFSNLTISEQDQKNICF